MLYVAVRVCNRYNKGKRNERGDKMDKFTMTPKEAAQLSGLGINRIRELCHVKGFPAFRNGNRFLIHTDCFREWLAAMAESRENAADLK